MQDALTPTIGAIALGAGIAIAAGAVLFMRRRRQRANDVFDLLGTTAASAKARVAAPPVDLSRPIATDAQWARIRRHASDPAYQRAVETIRLRYRLVTNPMLLPNTLYETMRHAGLNFREAVLRVAEDDGLHGHR